MDELYGARDGAVFFLSDGGRGFVLHRQDFGSVHHAHSMIPETARRQGGMDGGLIADQVQSVDPAVGLKGAAHAFDDHAATMVATHHIHCNSHNDGQHAANARSASWDKRLSRRR